MVAFNKEALCKEAEAYYFDFLVEDKPDIVPQHIFDHVICCERCRARIKQLGNVLACTCSNSEISQADTAIGTMLKLHFAYLGRPVTCKTVKPFLPTLLDPTLEIRIPTPIIVHLDHCQSCSKDLERIRELNLSRGQLCRLSQMYADRPKDRYIACPKAQAAVNPVVNLSLCETNTDVLKHLCLCSYCRELVSEARKFAIRLLPESAEGNEEPLCRQLSLSDIFDYAVPYGLDPSSDQYMKFRESLTSHIRKCPTCLSKIQELHETLFDIIDRPESGVVTVYNTIESPASETSAAEQPEDLYSGFPIRVEVSGLKDVAIKKQPTSPSIGTAAGARMFSIRRLAPLAKFGAVAAAVAIVAILFLFAMPSAKAVTLEQIYEAVLEVKTIHIAIFTSGKTEPEQERWVSRRQGIYVTKTGNELALWDVTNVTERHQNIVTGITKATQLEENALAATEEKISGSLGLMPFEDISTLPKDTQWHRLVDTTIPRDTSSLEVYDLLWAEKRYSGLSTLNKWRVYVDPETKLPRRTEFYQMLPVEQEYDLKSFKVIDYPTDIEMQAIIKQLSF
ncbi:MAG: hypothetical protein MUO27_11630 [Sedimentisphaerales bacterium]|nr:hypothetical protein [Sedimentisphaerales bacterium]